MVAPLLQTKSQLQRLHEIQQRPRRRPSSSPTPLPFDVQTTLTHPYHNLRNPIGPRLPDPCPSGPSPSATISYPAQCAVSPGLVGRSASTASTLAFHGPSGQPVTTHITPVASQTSQLVTHASPVASHTSQPVTSQMSQPTYITYPILQEHFGVWDAEHQIARPTPSESLPEPVAFPPSPGMLKVQLPKLAHRSRTKEGKAKSESERQRPEHHENHESREDHYKRLRDDLNLAKRLKMKLPAGLIERIDRLQKQSNALERFQQQNLEQDNLVDDLLPSRASSVRDVSPLANFDFRRPLEDLQQAVLSVKAEQNTIRRMQEEELLELCKLKHLLQREEMEQKAIERERKERKEQEAAAHAATEAAAEAAAAAAAALQLERQREALRVQQSKQEVALRVEQVLLSQAARREEFLQAELRRLDEEEQQVYTKSLELKRQAEVIEALSQKDYHSPSFTPQPKIATPIATSWAASSASAASGLRPKPCQEELADVEDIAVEEPRTLSPAGRQVLAGQGPLWQTPGTTHIPCWAETSKNQDEQESLKQAYLAFLNKEQSFEGEDAQTSPAPRAAVPATLPEGQGAAMKHFRGLEELHDLPQVYRAAVSIVAKHGWDALHGGENAGACWTALHWAAAEGRTDVCQLLLQCRADANHEDELGRCASYYAGLHGHLDTQALLKNGGTAQDRQDRKIPGDEEAEEGEMMSVASTRASAALVERASNWSLGTLRQS